MSAYSELVVSFPGVVALWSLDEADGNFLDSISGHHATPSGSITRAQSGLIEDGGSSVLVGSGGRIVATTSEDFDFGTGAFWVIGWFKAPPTGLGILLSWHGSAWIGIQNNSIYAKWSDLQNGGVTNVADNQVHFFCYSRTSGGQGNLWIDGSISPEITGSSFLDTSTGGANLGIGAFPDGSLSASGAYLDSFAIGKGSSLTAQQAKEVYDLGIGENPPPPVPVSSYTLTGPTSGDVGSPSGLFAITLGSGLVSGTIRFTPQSSTGSGTFSPTFRDLTDSVRSGTFRFTPSTSGTRTITAPDNAGLNDPVGIVYTANEVIIPPPLPPILSGRPRMVMVPFAPTMYPDTIQISRKVVDQVEGIDVATYPGPLGSPIPSDVWAQEIRRVDATSGQLTVHTAHMVTTEANHLLKPDDQIHYIDASGAPHTLTVVGESEPIGIGDVSFITECIEVD